MTYSNTFTPPSTTTNVVAFTGMPKRTMNTAKRMLPGNGDGSTLSLNFTSGVLDPRLTFTRSTTGTYINSSGYVTSAAINTPRFDHDPTTLAPRGLLIEGSANNLMTYSEDQGNNTTWSAFGTSVTRTTGQTDPGNNATASKLVFDATSADAVISRSVTVTNATQYTISMWMRADSGTVTNVRFARSAGSAGAIFPTLTTAWQRVSLTFTSSSTSDGIEIRVLNTGSPKTATVHLWGAQLEAGSGASSYIPTTASTGTREADFAVLNDLSAVAFNTAGGSMVMRGYQTKRASGSYPALAAFIDGTVDAADVFGFRNDVAGAVMFGRFAGTSTSAEAFRTITNNAPYAIGMSVNPTITTGALIVSMNGSSTTANKTGSATAISAPAKFALTRPGYALFINCGTISSIKYWPTVKIAAELNSLTTG
jgi:hypothetical protein